MRGLTKSAQEVMNDLLDRFDVRECDILSAILESSDPVDLIRTVEVSIKAPTMKTRSSTYSRRIEQRSIKPRASKYGFGSMAMGIEYDVHCDAHASPDQIIGSARLYAMRHGLDYWYMRLSGGRSVRVSFNQKNER